jgi:hypothetical protein
MDQWQEMNVSVLPFIESPSAFRDMKSTLLKVKEKSEKKTVDERKKATTRFTR